MRGCGGPFVVIPRRFPPRPSLVRGRPQTPVPASLMHICRRRQPPESPTEAGFPGGRNPATGPSDHRPQHDCPVGFPLSTSEGCHASAAMGSTHRTGSVRQRCRQSSTLRSERGSDCASRPLRRDRFRHRRPNDCALHNPVDVSRARRGGECSPLRRAQLRRPTGRRPAIRHPARVPLPRGWCSGARPPRRGDHKDRVSWTNRVSLWPV